MAPDTVRMTELGEPFNGSAQSVLVFKDMNGVGGGTTLANTDVPIVQPLTLLAVTE